MGLFTFIFNVYKYFWNIFYKLLQGEVNEDVYLNVQQLVNKYGYPFEYHYVTTEDGYILELHRIPHGINSSRDRLTKRPPLILTHGFSCDSMSWLTAGPDYAYPYIMADQGYDVWIVNCRGTRFSRKHKRWDIRKYMKEFFNFTLTEMACYDLAAIIDYAIKSTGVPKVFYTGHSQGTFLLFILLSERPNYNSKLQTAALFAPVMYTRNVKLISMRIGLRFYRLLKLCVRVFQIYTFNAMGNTRRRFLSYTCNGFPRIQKLYYYFVLSPVSGINPKNIDMNWLPFGMRHFPVATSFNQAMHMLQNAYYNKFQKFDYGPRKNLKLYGSKLPPEYKHSRISAPIALYIAVNDMYTSPEDIKRLKSSVASIVESYELPDKKFTHMDFVFSLNAKDILYPKVINLFKEFGA